MTGQFAIGVDTKVSIWCEDTGTDERGRHFHCLNGSWNGYIDREGKLHVEGDSKRHDVTIIWEGSARGRGYNESIQWIEAQLLGAASKLYGEPHPKASTWFWRETEGLLAGAIRGSTEMEALDRLREVFPDAGAIEWVKRISADPPKRIVEDDDGVPF